MTSLEEGKLLIFLPKDLKHNQQPDRAENFDNDDDDDGDEDDN